MRRLVVLAPSLALTATLLVASSVFSALLIGTNEPNVLIGTKNNDHITGAEGNDQLEGRAGNDTYFFADGWGTDTLIETTGAGTDSLNFRGVRGGGVSVKIIREWYKLLPEYTSVTGPGGSIPFSSPDNAAIEKVVGGQGSGDIIETGGGPHTLMPGGGGSNTLIDYGGWTSASGVRDMPASNDTYKGFAASTGTDLIEDWGGTDVVDMRPLSTDDVYLSRRNFDLDRTAESLQIVTGPSAQVILLGHYSSYLDHTSCCGQQGRIEKVIFADATFTTNTELSPAVSASAEVTSGKQATLAEAADQLAEEARALLAERPELGALPANVDDGDADKDEASKKHDTTKHEKKAKKAKTPRGQRR